MRVLPQDQKTTEMSPAAARECNLGTGPNLPLARTKCKVFCKLIYKAK